MAAPHFRALQITFTNAQSNPERAQKWQLLCILAMDTSAHIGGPV